jgi:hypothetical protein
MQGPDQKRDEDKLFIARFPYGNQENPDIAPWFQATIEAAKRHPAIGCADNVLHAHFDDTPITMTRNLAVATALAHGCRWLLMIDNDIRPDMQCNAGKTFFESSLNFLLDLEQPGVVVAPYCGPPPFSPVYVFQWDSGQNKEDMTVPQWKLEMVPRTEAAQRVGFEEVGAGPTGLILIDCRVFEPARGLQHPYFAYEWDDRREIQKATTEDVYFTRNLSLLGRTFNGGVWCNWDCWCGHHKRMVVPKPRPLYLDEVRKEYQDAVRNGLLKNQVVEQVTMKGGKIVRQKGSIVQKDRELTAEQILRKPVEQTNPFPEANFEKLVAELTPGQALLPRRSAVVATEAMKAALEHAFDGPLVANIRPPWATAEATEGESD